MFQNSEKMMNVISFALFKTYLFLVILIKVILLLAVLFCSAFSRMKISAK